MGIRVLLYGNLSSTGGIESHVFELAGLLTRTGCQVTVASLSCDFLDVRGDELNRQGIRTLSSGIRFQNSIRKKQAMALIRWPFRLGLGCFDVIVGFGSGGFFSLFRPFLMKGGHMIWSECGTGLRRRRMDPYCLTLRTVDGILCLTESGVRNLRAGYSFKAPIRALPHLTCSRVTLPSVGASTRRCAGEALSLGYFGRLDPGKNPLMLLRVFEKLEKGRFRLTFYGEGVLQHELEEQIGKRKLSSVVRVHGRYDHQKDLQQLMANVDLVVLPSSSEGLGLVLLEAMAHGVPFVASGIGGVRDLGDAPFSLVVDCDEMALRTGIERVAQEIWSGAVSPECLQEYYLARFGCHVVAKHWIEAICDPKAFWKT